MGLGWIIRYLFDFARALPERCKFHRDVEGSSSDEEVEEAKKRKIDQDRLQEEGPNK